MSTKNDKIVVGSRVLVFDPRLYRDDINTPPLLTFQPATVLKSYHLLFPDNREVVDVKFDRDGFESRAHFTWGVKELI